MATAERARRGDAGERPPATGRTCARVGGEPNPCASIIAQGGAVVNSGGQVALILRPGHAPEVTVSANSERQEAELCDLLGLARRLARLAGSVTP